jgi:hypothetical protein
VIARSTDAKKLISSIDKEEQKNPGSFIQITEPSFENLVVAGEPETTARCNQAHQNGQNLVKQQIAPTETGNPPAIRTFGVDRETAVLLASVLSERKSDDAVPVSRYVVETRFKQKGIERRLVSEFGLLSSIITMLASEE